MASPFGSSSMYLFCIKSRLNFKSRPWFIFWDDNIIGNYCILPHKLLLVILVKIFSTIGSILLTNCKIEGALSNWWFVGMLPIAPSSNFFIFGSKVLSKRNDSQLKIPSSAILEKIQNVLSGKIQNSFKFIMSKNRL